MRHMVGTQKNAPVDLRRPGADVPGFSICLVSVSLSLVQRY
jgi:hypothetical protein